MLKWNTNEYHTQNMTVSVVMYVETLVHLPPSKRIAPSPAKTPIQVHSTPVMWSYRGCTSL
jgi:hypothetical protein